MLTLQALPPDVVLRCSPNVHPRALRDMLFLDIPPSLPSEPPAPPPRMPPPPFPAPFMPLPSGSAGSGGDAGGASVVAKGKGRHHDQHEDMEHAMAANEKSQAEQEQTEFLQQPEARAEARADAQSENPPHLSRGHNHPLKTWVNRMHAHHDNELFWDVMGMRKPSFLETTDGPDQAVPHWSYFAKENGDTALGFRGCSAPLMGLAEAYDDEIEKMIEEEAKEATKKLQEVGGEVSASTSVMLEDLEIRKWKTAPISRPSIDVCSFLDSQLCMANL